MIWASFTQKMVIKGEIKRSFGLPSSKKERGRHRPQYAWMQPKETSYFALELTIIFVNSSSLKYILF